MKTPTIFDIKNNCDSHFFDRATLRGFGQKMSDFRVYKTGDPTVFQTVAPRFYDRKPIGQSVHYWKLVGPNEFTLLGTTSEGES